jgi:hypothetical protein
MPSVIRLAARDIVSPSIRVMTYLSALLIEVFLAGSQLPVALLAKANSSKIIRLLDIRKQR